MAHHIGHFKASFKANYIDFFYLVDEFWMIKSDVQLKISLPIQHKSVKINLSFSQQYYEW